MAPKRVQLPSDGSTTDDDSDNLPSASAPKQTVAPGSKRKALPAEPPARKQQREQLAIDVDEYAAAMPSQPIARSSNGLGGGAVIDLCDDDFVGEDEDFEVILNKINQSAGSKKDAGPAASGSGTAVLDIDNDPDLILARKLQAEENEAARSAPTEVHLSSVSIWAPPDVMPRRPLLYRLRCLPHRDHPPRLDPAKPRHHIDPLTPVKTALMIR
jgi:hypothetical protein